MLYVLLGEDAPHSLERRRQSRAEHLRRLESLQAEGRLILAGPFPAIDAIDPGPAGFSGSLIVGDFASQAGAEAWLAADPYVTQGVFQRTEVRPFKQVFPV